MASKISVIGTLFHSAESQSRCALCVAVIIHASCISSKNQTLAVKYTNQGPSCRKGFEYENTEYFTAEVLFFDEMQEACIITATYSAHSGWLSTEWNKVPSIFMKL